MNWNDLLQAFMACMVIMFVFALVTLWLGWNDERKKREFFYQARLARYKNVVITPDWKTVGELPEDEQRLAVAAVRRAELEDPEYVKKWSKDEVE